MAAYDYDDDDTMDYSGDGGNSGMNFSSERDLDDYLNNEEYDMMNLMFPEVVKYLENNDYYGYDNLTVKLAIFDNDFNIDHAKEELSGFLKQKKPKVVAETPKKIQTSTTTNTNGESRNMSLLERLALSKLESKNSTVSNTRTDHGKVNSLPSEKKMTLAERLQLKRGSQVPSVSGTADEQSSRDQSKPQVSSDKKIITDKTAEKKLSLAERLQQKRLQSANVANIKDIPEKKNNNKTQIPILHKQNNTAKLDWFDDLQNENILLNEKFPVIDPPMHASLQISKMIVETNVNGKQKNDTNEGKKRNFDDIFTIYYPNTNIKKIAIENFNKPSPDDVIINAQQAAFQNVNKKIQSLSIEKTPKTEDAATGDINNVDDDEESEKNEVVTVIHKYKKVSEPTKPREKIDVKSYIEEFKKHPHISFVVLGHVDAGKSTLMGRLLYDVGAVDTKLIRKLQKESEIMGKSSFHLAWVMDQTSEERERGVTVDICTSNFQTDNCSFTIVDAPGHIDFIGNAISGISQADVAILCVDCSTDAFESGFNLDGQTKEHAILARSLGMKHLVVAMNKLDSMDWSKQRFNEIKDQLSVFFQMIGFNPDQNISWVPCSGLTGDGVVKNKWSSPKQNWYSGPSLVQELENVAHKFVNEDENLNRVIKSLELNEEVDLPFLFNVWEVIPSSKNGECVISGKIEQGFIQPGESIVIYPSEQSCVVDQVSHQQDEHNLLKIGIEGDFVNLKLKSSNSDDIHCGDLCTVVGNELQNSKSFQVQLLTFDMGRPLLPGTPLILYRGSREQPASVKKLVQILDKNDSTKVLKKKVKHLGSNQLALVELELSSKDQNIPMLTNKENKYLSKLVIRKEGRTIGAGVVTQLT